MTVAASALPAISVGCTNPSRPSVVSGESRVGRQARDEPRRRLDRVDELALGGAGMDADAVERHLQLDRRPRLVLDLADDRAVERVREVGPEGLEVEVVDAAPDLLVDGEPDARARARHLGMRDEPGDRRHDLRDSGLVVGAEQRRAVRGDDVVPDALREQCARRGREPGHEVAAVVALVHLRLDAGAGRVGADVDVREQSDRRARRRRPASRRRSRAR